MSSRYAKNTDSVVANDAALHYSGSNAFPDYPREKVNSKEWKDFWDCMNTILESHESFGHLQRGAMPSSWLKYELADETGLTVLVVPSMSNAKYLDIVRHNQGVQKILRENQSRKMQLNALMDTATRSLAAQCQASLRTNAPLLLLALEKECAVPVLMASVPPPQFPAPIEYDGAKMLQLWRAAGLKKSNTQHITSRWHEQQWESMRDSKLADGCASSDFSDKVTTLIRDHRPHFKTVRLDGEDLSRAIINFLPHKLSGFGVTLEAEMIKMGTMDDHLIVNERCEALVAGDADPILETARLACAFKVVTNTATVPAAAGVTYTQKQVDALISRAKGTATTAAAATAQSDALALAAAKVEKTNREKRLQQRSDFTLPNGEWCADGTCHGKHGEKYAGEHCMRDATWAGPCHTRHWSNKKQMESVERGRKSCAEGDNKWGKKMKQVKLLPPPGGPTVPGGALALVDSMNGIPSPGFDVRDLDPNNLMTSFNIPCSPCIATNTSLSGVDSVALGPCDPGDLRYFGVFSDEAEDDDAADGIELADDPDDPFLAAEVDARCCPDGLLGCQHDDVVPMHDGVRRQVGHGVEESTMIDADDDSDVDPSYVPATRKSIMVAQPSPGTNARSTQLAESSSSLKQALGADEKTAWVEGGEMEMKRSLAAQRAISIVRTVRALPQEELRSHPVLIAHGTELQSHMGGDTCHTPECEILLNAMETVTDRIVRERSSTASALQKAQAQAVELFEAEATLLKSARSAEMSPITLGHTGASIHSFVPEHGSPLAQSHDRRQVQQAIDVGSEPSTPLSYERRMTSPTAGQGSREMTANDMRLRVESLRPDTVRMHQLKAIVNDMGLSDVVSTQTGTSPARRSRLDIIGELRQRINAKPLEVVDPLAVSEFRAKLKAKIVLVGDPVTPGPRPVLDSASETEAAGEESSTKAIESVKAPSFLPDSANVVALLISILIVCVAVCAVVIAGAPAAAVASVAAVSAGQPHAAVTVLGQAAAGANRLSADLIGGGPLQMHLISALILLYGAAQWLSTYSVVQTALHIGRHVYLAVTGAPAAAGHARAAGKHIVRVSMLASFMVMLSLIVRGVGGSPTEHSVSLARQVVMHAPEHIRPTVQLLSQAKFNVSFVGNFLSADDADDIAGTMQLNDASMQAVPVCPMGLKRDAENTSDGSSTGPPRKVARPGAGVALLDSGAGIDASPGNLKVAPNSYESTDVVISTANGLIKPQFTCTQLLPTRDRKGRESSVPLFKSVVLDNCPHTLVSGGKLAATRDVGIWIAPGNEMSYMRPNRHDHSFDVPLLNVGVLVIPGIEIPMSAYAGVVRGTKGNDTSRSGDFLHDTFNHTTIEKINRMPDCTNAHKSWRNAKCSGPCECCSHARVDRISSGNHIPVCTAPGEIQSMDVWTNQDGHVHGGQRKVIAFYDLYARLSKSWLMHNESAASCGTAFAMHLAWCGSYGVTVRRIHTDNAPSLCKAQIGKMCLEAKPPIRITTCAPFTPKQNTTSEGRWRQKAKVTTTALIKGKMSRAWWWYAWLDGEQKSWCIPFDKPEADGKYSCPWKRFTGRDANAVVQRPCFQRMYVKDYDPVSKVAAQGIMCILLCRSPDQSAYVGWDVIGQRTRITPHAHFFHGVFPGLSRKMCPKEAEAVKHPWFADVREPSDADVQPNAPEPGAAPTAGDSSDSYDSESSDSMPSLASASGSDDEAPPPDRAPSWISQRRKKRKTRAPQPPGSTISRRLTRVGRGERNVHNAQSLVQLDSDVHALGVPDGGNFVLYLGSGLDHAHSIRSQLGDDIYTVNIDKAIGGYTMDLSLPHVREAVEAAASMDRCVGVFASLDCSTYSVLRYNKTSTQDANVRRRLPDHADGIPKADGTLPSNVREANASLATATAAARLCTAHGGFACFESPPSRAKGQPFAVAGREDHSSMFDTSVMTEWMADAKSAAVYVDQCATGATAQKTTRFECSPNFHAHLAKHVGRFVCSNAPKHTHESVPGAVDAQGKYKSAALSKYLEPLTRGIADAVIDFMCASGKSWCAPELKPNANMACETDASPMDDWQPGDGPHTYQEDDDDTPLDYLSGSQPNCSYRTASVQLKACFIAAAAIANDVPHMLFSEFSSRMDECLATTVDTPFGHSIPLNAVNIEQAGDSPSWQQAMSGEEWREWDKGACKEMDKFEQLDLYDEVPEDSLPTWDPVKRRASEVVPILLVPKKVRGDDHEVVKWKVRACWDGHREQAIAKGKGIELDGFAPTVRHTTFKLHNACATRRGDICEQIDVTSAYHRGKIPEDMPPCYARPPRRAVPGKGTRFQKYDERDVPIVLKMKVPTYGQTMAGPYWYQTLMKFLITERGFSQSEFDPCYVWKRLPNGTRIDVSWYVDDGWVSRQDNAESDAEIKAIDAEFPITRKPGSYFLGCNVDATPGKCTISMRTYLESLAAKYLPKPLDEYPVYDTPSTDEIRDAYKEALLRNESNLLDKDGRARYMSKCGAAIYACPAARIGDTYTIGMCARCLTFPTVRMEKCLDRCIVHMAQTCDRGITYDGTAADFACWSDSDWDLSASTSAHASSFAGAVVGWASKRQHSVSLSSTEAEIMAASLAACEILYFRGLLAEMGFPQSKPTVLWVDNMGAVALAKHRCSSVRSRHIERRYLHLRELVAAGEIEVRYVPTADNVADLLTKPLAKDVHMKHVSKASNTAAKEPKKRFVLDGSKSSHANMAHLAKPPYGMSHAARTHDVVAQWAKHAHATPHGDGAAHA